MLTRVLVTDADTPKSLAIVRAVGRGSEVWTAAESGLSLAGSSRFTHSHLKYDFKTLPGFPDWILEVCKKHQISVVIPPEESSSLLLAQRESDFLANGIRLGSLPLCALEIAMDKAETIRSAEACGIPIPPTRILDRNDDAAAAARELGYPVVIKPRFSRYWNGDRFIASDGVAYAECDDQVAKAMQALDPALPPPILQGFVPGKGVGVCILLGKDGALRAEFAHQRLRDFRPTGSGSVLRKSVPMNPQLREMSVRLLQSIGCRGVAMVEFRTDERTGNACLMEINGRFWGSLQLAIDAGVNFPLLLVKSLLDESFDKPVYRSGVHVRWWIGDFIRTLRVMKGRPQGFTGDFPPRLKALAELLGRQPRGTKSEVLRWDDWRPSIVEPISIFRRLFQ